jgi:GT2 family glycosyltransferase
MNGNLVLLPIEIARAVGNLDPVYEHAAGDIDYALRARKAGYRLFVAPGFVGHCSHNPRAGSFLDRSLPFAERWKKIMSRKGLPPHTWRHFTRRHGGAAWPIYFVWPYFKLLVDGIRGIQSDIKRSGK